MYSSTMSERFDEKNEEQFMASFTSTTNTNTSLNTSTTSLSTSTSTSTVVNKNPWDKLFPWILHRILDDAESKSFEDIISWVPSTNCFRIHKRTDFEKVVIPQYFEKSIKYKSFQRQLNMYDFVRVPSGPNKGSYMHDYLVRGYPDLCKKMIRTKVKGEKRTKNHQNLIATNNIAMTQSSNDIVNKCLSQEKNKKTNGVVKSSPAAEIAIVDTDETKNNDEFELSIPSIIFDLSENNDCVLDSILQEEGNVLTDQQEQLQKAAYVSEEKLFSDEEKEDLVITLRQKDEQNTTIFPSESSSLDDEHDDDSLEGSMEELLSCPMPNAIDHEKEYDSADLSSLYNSDSIATIIDIFSPEVESKTEQESAVLHRRPSLGNNRNSLHGGNDNCGKKLYSIVKREVLNFRERSATSTSLKKMCRGFSLPLSPSTSGQSTFDGDRVASIDTSHHQQQQHRRTTSTLFKEIEDLGFMVERSMDFDNEFDDDDKNQGQNTND